MGKASASKGRKGKAAGAAEHLPAAGNKAAPIVGQSVHFVDKDGRCQAAIITSVDSFALLAYPPEDQAVNLFVPVVGMVERVVRRPAAPTPDDAIPETWHPLEEDLGVNECQ